MIVDNFQLKKGNYEICCDINRLPITGGNYKLTIWSAANHKCADLIENKIDMVVEDDDFYGKGKPISAHLKGKIVLCDYRWQL